MPVIILLSANIFIYFSFHILDQGFSATAQPTHAGLYRDPYNPVLRYANFKEHFYHVLDVPNIERIAVQTSENCLFRCVDNDRCFSANVAAAFPGPDGNVSCDLLLTDKYNASDKFKANHTFHHYSIKSPCENLPCQHGETCRALYATDDFSCICTHSYTGTNCEIAAGSCTDKRNDCCALARDNHCRTNPYATLRECPETCGVCDNCARPCDDRKSDCENLRNQCHSKPYATIMDCPLTCGVCD